MAKYSALVLVDVELEASDDDTARNTISNIRFPPTVRVVNRDVRLKRHKTPDRRLVAHIPNLPKAQVQSQLAKLSAMQVMIVASCQVKPRHLGSLIDMTQKQGEMIRAEQPGFAYSRDNAIEDITRLSNDGWLCQVHHAIELDQFPSMDVQAQFSALSGSKA